jgi:predicted alpha/beta-fold hydrolase
VKLNRFLLAFFLIFSFECKSEIIFIPFEKDDTPTAYWTNTSAKATLIFLPGGDGSFGISNKPNLQPSWLFKSFNTNESKIALDLVIMDSRTSLGWKNGDVEPRYQQAHINRIKTVIDYYQQKIQLPVFLIGHSNGAISLASFLNQSSENQKKIKGIIFSGSRNETDVKNNLNLPILVMHHKNDTNSWTTPVRAERLFNEIKLKNSASTDLNFVDGGFDEGNPAISGRHMYAGSLNQAAKFVEEFIVKNIDQ